MVLSVFATEVVAPVLWFSNRCCRRRQIGIVSITIKAVRKISEELTLFRLGSNWRGNQKSKVDCVGTPYLKALLYFPNPPKVTFVDVGTSQKWRHIYMGVFEPANHARRAFEADIEFSGISLTNSILVLAYVNTQAPLLLFRPPVSLVLLSRPHSS